MRDTLYTVIGLFLAMVSAAITLSYIMAAWLTPIALFGWLYYQ